jgi:hypothetical protein
MLSTPTLFWHHRRNIHETEVWRPNQESLPMTSYPIDYFPQRTTPKYRIAPPNSTRMPYPIPSLRWCLKWPCLKETSTRWPTPRDAECSSTGCGETPGVCTVGPSSVHRRDSDTLCPSAARIFQRDSRGIPFRCLSCENRSYGVAWHYNHRPPKR